MDALQQTIGYTYKNKELLKRALSHSSYANEKGCVYNSNERLEFLGDSVLGVISAEYFFNKYKNMPEGELTKLRASAVCEQSLYKFACEIDLGKYLYLGKGEVNMGGRERPSILADAFEALIASIYLDGGMANAKKFVLKFITEIDRENAPFSDYKTMLQEVIQKNPEEVLSYVVTHESGPDHDKRFEVEVHLNSNVIGKGIGKTKKHAEQEAAKEALELMGL